MKLCALFSDHAVLQRDLPLPIWGWTKPSLRVRATLNGVTAETMASPEGAFLLRLPPCAAGGPYTLDVVTTDASEHARIQDVLIGEVWVCSGQSNMEFSVASALPDPDPQDVPSLRMFTVPRLAEPGRATNVNGRWQLGTANEVPSFSAVGYYFGRKLSRELGVPVGLVHTSWGGTRIEAWTSREELMRLPRTRQHVEDYERHSAEPDYWSNAFGAFGTGTPQTPRPGAFPPDPGNLGEGRGWARTDFDDTAWPSMTVPCSWKACGQPNNGSFWYRKAVTLPAAWKGRDLLLGIGAVDKHDVTYVNGERVGAMGKDSEEGFWSVPREYPVPARLVAGGKVLIAVRAYSFVYDGGLIGPAHRMVLRPADGAAGESISLAGEWRATREHDLGLVVPPALQFGPGNPNTPHILFDNMISPIVPYGIRGAIWYQGESNAGSAETARDYCGLQLAMVRDWRRAWGQGDFPFIAVQLAAWLVPTAFDMASKWSLLRESQLEATRHPGIGLASALDVGDAKDIHPKNKRDVGFRLAQWALVEEYGRPGPAMGPRPIGATLERGAIRVRFDNVGSGLVARGGGPLQTFFVAGTNRKFSPAVARIDGTAIVAASPDVPEPVALRYAWADNPEGCNLYNAEGLPASPFRTDDW